MFSLEKRTLGLIHWVFLSNPFLVMILAQPGATVSPSKPGVTAKIDS